MGRNNLGGLPGVRSVTERLLQPTSTSCSANQPTPSTTARPCRGVAMKELSRGTAGIASALGVADPPEEWWLLQDNAPSHKARIVQDWLFNHGVKLLDFPPYSPDLNALEN